MRLEKILLQHSPLSLPPLFFLTPSLSLSLQSEMSDCLQNALKFINDLGDSSLKDKEVGCVFDLLKTLKTLLRRCNMMDMATRVDTLRLTTTLRMFQIPHFNAKMNALKEVLLLLYL